MTDAPDSATVDPWAEQARMILEKVNVQAQPRVLIELNRLARQPDVSFEQVADLVSRDVGLSAKLLKLASSPIFSRGQRFESVHEALMAIGLQEFKRCFLSVSIESFLGKVGYSCRGFWDHSKQVATYCQVLAQRLCPCHAHAAYTLGLFHDVGAVLIPLHNRAYAEHVERTLPLYFGITDLEYGLVKTNHCAVGEMFARNWALCDEILTPLRYHHSPEFKDEWEVPVKELKALLQLAELFNDKHTRKDNRLTPFAQSKDTLVRACEILDLMPNELGDLEEEILEIGKTE